MPESPTVFGWPMAGLAALDWQRRIRGLWLDQMGFGPIRTPAKVVWTGPGARVLAYGEATAGPVLLILPAPIKRATIWDLAPPVSVVHRCLSAGQRVYMLEWLDPDAHARRTIGLVEATSTITAALGAVAAITGERRTILAGHSLGGTLAALATAQQPERIAGLVLIEAPLGFGARAGALAPLVAQTPRATVAALGRDAVPGSLLTLAAVAAAPDAFLATPWRDWLASAANPSALALHFRVERWTLDELAMPGPLFIDIVERLYREDQFATGSLCLRGAPVEAGRLSAIPVLAVVEPHSRIVPPASALDLLTSLSMPDLQVHPYEGETGVALQHVRALVGPAAHRTLWPEILSWIARHWN